VRLVLACLNLDQFSIIRLATVVMALSIGVYLFSIKGKTVSTLQLAFAFLGFTLFNFSMFIMHAERYYWQPYNVKNLVYPYMMALGASLSGYSFLLFSYHFPRFGEEDRVEYTVVLVFFAVVGFAILGMAFYNFGVLQRTRSRYDFNPAYFRALAASISAQYFLAAFLMARKTASLSRGEGKPLLRRLVWPSGAEARAARSFAAALFVSLAALVGFVTRLFGLLEPITMIYVVCYVLLLFSFLLIFTYLNHTGERTTFQAKLVFGALVVMLAIVGLIGIIEGRSNERDYANAIENRVTFRFVPNEHGSYTISRAPRSFDSDLGRRLDVPYGSARREALSFPFPFYGRSYGAIRVMSGPMIFLGDDTGENGWGGYHPRPAIAPVIMNLDPSGGGGIYLKSEAGEATVTWHEVPEFGRGSKNTVQLALRRDGVFEMRYERLEPDPLNRSRKTDVYPYANMTGTVLGTEGTRGAAFSPRLAGIHPGGRDAALQRIRFSEDLPYTSEEPGAIFEAYDIDFYDFLHARSAPLAAVLVASSLFVLFAFPLLMKTSLTRPLHVLFEGMERAAGGNLDVTVQPKYNDEIGFLTRSFNRMLRSIRNIEGNFKALAENAQDGILILSTGGACLFANRKACDIVGFEESTFEKFDLFAPLRFEKPVKGEEFFGEDTDEEAAPRRFEGAIVRSSAPETPVELTVNRTLWHGNAALVVVLRDIAERKRLEEETIQRQRDLLQMDKLTALGTLVAAVAHEINNPNQAILSNASYLVRARPQLLALLREREGVDPETLIAGLGYDEFLSSYPGFVETIEKSSFRIDEIVKGLRAFSLEDQVNIFAIVDVNAVVRSAVKLIEYYVKKATDDLTLRLDEGISRVRGNALRLEQVFINLVINACQALSDRGQAISVSSSRDLERCTVCVTVRDEGTGIPPGDLNRVREPFFTTKRNQGGTGLGLYVCETIVTEHRGALRIESTPGRGTVVTVSLPAEVIDEP
jgi:PAS domain S-box-containing protein